MKAGTASTPTVGGVELQRRLTYAGAHLSGYLHMYGNGIHVRAGDLQRSATAVGDPVVVLGPKGAGPISPAQFADWVERSGIKLIPRSWHPVSVRLMVVEEDATWPESTKSTRVATVFRASGGKITAALRLPDLKAALELAYICREMAATE